MKKFWMFKVKATYETNEGDIEESSEFVMVCDSYTPNSDQIREALNAWISDSDLHQGLNVTSVKELHKSELLGVGYQ